MPNSLAQDLANARLGLIVAPAGCGKTHLISEAVGASCGRQLVLTHTHAGVKAIRDRMTRLGVPSDQFRVVTIDAFALKYAGAFSTISGWTTREPEGKQWRELRPAALATLQVPAIIDVLKASYSGVFVDEYQDCTVGQHALIMQLASILPCRVFGDPLQAIFRKLNKEDALSWKTVTESFPMIGELTQPRRWDGKNEDLGRWLLCARNHLSEGKPLDLGSAPGIQVRICDPDDISQIAACYALMKLGGPSVVGLRAWRAQCHRLSGRLNNTFHTFEDAQCEDLVEWGRKIEAASGSDRVGTLAEFAEKWLTRLPGPLVKGAVVSVLGNKVCRARRADVVRLHNALCAVRDQPSLGGIIPVLEAYLSFDEKPVHVSREIWTGLKEAAREAAGQSGTTLVQAIANSRERLRRFGRHPGQHSLATPLLVKGLEFDHVAILDAADFSDAESVYVSLTRASRSMIVLTKNATLTVPRPTA